MESQAFEGLMKTLPDEVKAILVLVVFLVLFYPRLVAFFGHFSPQERAIRKARRRREMEELGIAPQAAERPPSPAPPVPDTPVPDTPVAGMAARDVNPEATAAAPAAEARGIWARLARLQTPQFIWCFAGAFLTHGISMLFVQFQLAEFQTPSLGPYVPYVMIAPTVLIYGGLYALGLAVLGVVFFGNRGRWGSVLLGFGMAAALWLLEYAKQLLLYG